MGIELVEDNCNEYGNGLVNPKQIPKLCSGMLLPARLSPGDTFAFSAADTERAQDRAMGREQRLDRYSYSRQGLAGHWVLTKERRNRGRDGSSGL